MNSCPTTEILRQWFAGTPNGPERQVIEAHVKECVTCRQTLAGLGGDPPASGQPLRASESPITPRYPVPPDFLRRLEANNPLLATAEEPEREDVHFPGPPTDRGPLGRLGRFHMIEELGRGNFGFVFRAWDEQLGREVAIKILKPELAASDKDRTRLVKEAQAAAGIDSDHVVRVHEAGSLPDFASPFLVMEYIPGETLAAILKRRTTLPPAEAAEICRQVALGLAAAHARKLIHRDVKPSNIVLVPHTSDQGGRTWRAKITDFGLARAIEAMSEGSVRSGQLVGTPAYMSPEQITAPRSLDGRSDVYSLGVVLYEVLTGERPFRGVTYHAVLNQVMHEEPGSPRRLNPAIPRDLGTICLKALAKEPGRRYASAGDMADDLRRFLDGRPIQARPAGAGERLWRWCRRNPAVAGLTAAVALVILSGFAGVTWQWRRAEANRQQAEQIAEANRRLLYVANIKLAHQAWQNADIQRMMELLDRNIPRADQQDLREFAWYYLWRLCHGERPPLKGHTGEIQFVTFSPDGKMLASASKDTTVRLWDTTTGKELATLRTEAGEVNCVAFAPDGKTLASAHDDGAVRLWHTGERGVLTPRSTLRGHEGDVLAVAFSPDGTTLASAGRDGVIKLWDPKTEQAGQMLKRNTQRIQALAFAPNGQTLASAGNDCTVKLWDLAQGKAKATLQGHSDCIQGVAFSHDGKRIATASQDGTVRLWDAVSGQQGAIVQRHSDWIQCVAFSADDRTLASAGRDATVRVSDVATGRERNLLRGHVGRVWGVAFSPDGRTLASAGADGTVRLWNPAERREVFTLEQPSAPVSALAVSPDGTMLAAALYRNVRVRRWRGRWGRGDFLPEEFTVGLGENPGTCFGMTFAPDGQTLALGCEEGKVLLCNPRAFPVIAASTVGLLGSCLEQGPFLAASALTPERTDPSQQPQRLLITKDTGNICAMAFSPPKGHLLAVGQTNGDVSLWEVATRAQRAVLRGHTDMVRGIAFSPRDGQMLATCSNDGLLKLWDLATGKERVAGTRRHHGAILGVAFAPDGRALATAGPDRAVKLWDAETGQEQTTLFGHQDKVTSVAYTRDGQTLATGSDDGTVRLWDVRTRQELLTLEGHRGKVKALAFAPDGKTLFSAEDAGRGEGVIHLWIAALDEEAAGAN